MLTLISIFLFLFLSSLSLSLTLSFSPSHYTFCQTHTYTQTNARMHSYMHIMSTHTHQRTHTLLYIHIPYPLDYVVGTETMTSDTILIQIIQVNLHVFVLFSRVTLFSINFRLYCLLLFLRIYSKMMIILLVRCSILYRDIYHVINLCQHFYAFVV